jgi:hypothetical protein
MARRTKGRSVPDRERRMSTRDSGSTRKIVPQSTDGVLKVLKALAWQDRVFLFPDLGLRA